MGSVRVFYKGWNWCRQGAAKEASGNLEFLVPASDSRTRRQCPAVIRNQMLVL